MPAYPIPIDPGALASDGILTINPFGALFLVIDILEWTGVIPDPLDLLFQEFSGRPRELDTVNVAAWLLRARNPAARIWGSLLSRGLTELNIVLSSSDTFGATYQNNIRHQFVLSQVAQGFTLIQAKKQAEYAIAATNSPSQSYLPAFQAGLAAGKALNGPGEWVNEFMARYQQRIAAGDSTDTAYKKAFKYTLKNLPLKYLQKVLVGDPQQPPAPPPPGGTPLCPPGYTWDAQLAKCVFTPTPVTNPILQQPDPNGDEITDLCTCISNAVLQAAQIIAGGGTGLVAPGSGGGGTDIGCCDNIVAAINAVAAAMAPAGGGATTVDVTVDTTPIADAIAGLKDAIAAIPAPVVNVTAGAPTDLSEVVQKLKELNETDIAGKDLLDQLVALQLIDPQVGQLLGDPVRVRIDPSRFPPETIKILKWMGGADPAEEARFIAYFKDLIARLFKWANNELGKLITGDNVPATTILAQLKQPALDLVANASDYTDVMPRALMQLTETVIANGDPLTPDNAEERGFRAFGFAFLIGQGIHVLADLGKFLGYPMSSLWSNNAALAVELLAYDDIRKNLHGPFWETAIGANRRYQVHTKFRPFVPMLGPALGMYARRQLDDPALDKLLGYHGVHPDYVAATKYTAYRPISPRALSQAFIDTVFPRDEVRALLEDNGLRPSAVTTLLNVLEANSVKNVRQQYEGAVVTAWERGILSDADALSHLDDLNFSDQAKHFVQLTVAVRKLQQLAEIYRKSITAAYEYGQIGDADYVPALEAIGIAEADAKAHYAVDSIRKHGKEAIAAARAAAALQHVIDHAAVAAAKADFKGGILDDIALAARLLAANVPPAAIPFVVELETQRRKSNKRYVYGAFVTPLDAIQLREQVAALKEQRLKHLIDDAAALARLASFNIPAKNAADLVAEWAAQADKALLPIQ